VRDPDEGKKTHARGQGENWGRKSSGMKGRPFRGVYREWVVFALVENGRVRQRCDLERRAPRGKMGDIRIGGRGNVGKGRRRAAPDQGWHQAVAKRQPEIFSRRMLKAVG